MSDRGGSSNEFLRRIARCLMEWSAVRSFIGELLDI